MKNPVHKKHKRMESQSNKEYYELTTDTLLKKDNYHPENMDRLASQPQKNHHQKDLIPSMMADKFQDNAVSKSMSYSEEHTMDYNSKDIS